MGGLLRESDLANSAYSRAGESAKVGGWGNVAPKKKKTGVKVSAGDVGQNQKEIQGVQRGRRSQVREMFREAITRPHKRNVRDQTKKENVLLSTGKPL